MARNHLSIAILSAASGTTVRALAETCGVDPSTLSRLISENRRIGSETLEALCSRLSYAAGTQILLGHINDEITRSGRSTLDWTVQPKQPGVADISDLAMLESAISGPSKLTDDVANELNGLVHHLANLVRSHRAREAAARAAATRYPQAADQGGEELAAAEPMPDTSLQGTPHPMEEALRARAAGNLAARPRPASDPAHTPPATGSKTARSSEPSGSPARSDQQNTADNGGNS